MHAREKSRMHDAPVKMFWNADSTLLASSAEVSMKESPFSAGQTSMADGQSRVCHLAHTL